MRQSDESKELFRPTLTEADDDLGFAAPWSPYAALWAAFLGGLPAAGWMLAVNFRRLGLRAWAAPSLIGALVMWVATSTAVVIGYADGTLEVGERTLVRMLLRAIAVVSAGLVVVRQRRRWRLYESLDRPTGRPWVHLSVSIVATWLATPLLMSLLHGVLRGTGDQ